jgi:hypothetical protein
MQETQFGQKHAFVASEFHYFRLSRDRWPLGLARIRQLGATTLVVPVVWAWHAPSADFIDLDGTSHPERDLRALVELCAQLGLKLILDLGPSFKLGLLNDGIPLWLAKRYPQAHALQADGKPYRDELSGLEAMSALHPDFLAALASWFQALNALLRDQQAPNGPIIALHASGGLGSNEQAFQLLDLNPALVDCWHAWLEDAFQSLESLNLRWKTDYRSFAHVPLSHQLSEIERLPPGPQSSDYAAFWAFCAERFEQELGDLLSAAGWHVPLVDLHSCLVAEPDLLQNDCHGLLSFKLQRGRMGEQGRTQLQKLDLNACDPFGLALAFEAEQGIVYEHPIQSVSEPADLAVGVSWTQRAALRPDGTVHSRFWHLKGILSLIEALGEASRPVPIAPELAIGISRSLPFLRSLSAARSVAGASLEGGSLSELVDYYEQNCLQLARTLSRVGVPFSLVDLDSASPETLQAQAFLLVPESPLLDQEVRRKIALCERLYLLTDERYPNQQRLPKHTYAALNSLPESWKRLLEEQIAWQRSAWADHADIDLQLRYGQPDATNDPLVYLWIANRRNQNYSGMIAYRAYDGSIEHLHVTIGPLRSGLVVLQQGDLIAVSMDGDYSEGSWIVRALRSSVVWNGGSALIVPYNTKDEALHLLVSSPHSGKLSIRYHSVWPNLSAYRLLLNGELLPAEVQLKQELLTLNYLAEDGCGQSDAYLVCPSDAVVCARLRHKLNAQLLARAALIEQQAQRLASRQNDLRQERAMLQAVSAQYEALANDHYSPTSYAHAWQINHTILQQVIEALQRRLLQARVALASGDEAGAQQQQATLLEQVLIELATL